MRPKCGWAGMSEGMWAEAPRSAEVHRHCQAQSLNMGNSGNFKETQKEFQGRVAAGGKPKGTDLFSKRSGEQYYLTGLEHMKAGYSEFLRLAPQKLVGQII